MYTVHKYFQCFLYSAVLAWAISTTAALAADATSFNPVNVSVSAASSGGVPVGTVIAWPVSTNPDDFEKWLECNGQSIPTSYTALRAIVGTTTPNYQGLFLRGNGSQIYGQTNGSSIGYTNTTHSSGSLGVVQGDAIRNITGSMGYMPLKVGSKSNLEAPTQSAIYVEQEWTSTYTDSTGQDVGVSFGFNASRMISTASEVRPVNIAVRYLIRALP